MRILLAVGDPESIAPFARGLEDAGGVSLLYAQSGAEALARAREASPDLAVIGDDLKDTTPFALVAGLMGVNAMIFTAVISDMGEREFHEAGEGLGILTRLPASPGAADARSLLERLSTVRGS